jgi:hypothetical protein
MLTKKTIKPLDLTGLRTLLDLKVDPNILDLDNLSGLLTDPNFIQELISGGWDCNNNNISQTICLVAFDCENVYTILQNVNILLSNGLDCTIKNRTHFLPMSDFDWICDRNLLTISLRGFDLIDVFIMKAMISKALCVDDLRDLICSAAHNGYVIPPYTLFQLVMTYTEFRYDLFETKDKDIVTDIQYFYIMTQYMGTHGLDMTTFLEFAEHIDLGMMARSISDETFVIVVKRIILTCDDDVRCAFVENNFVKTCVGTSKSCVLRHIQFYYNNNTKQMYEQFGFTFTEKDLRLISNSYSVIDETPLAKSNFNKLRTC